MPDDAPRHPNDLAALPRQLRMDALSLSEEERIELLALIDRKLSRIERRMKEREVDLG
jgi:hypothetical protein